MRNIKVLVDKKPYPISVEMRPIWRISLLVVSIAVTGKGKDYLDITKVNILVWMLIRKNRWSEYEGYLLDRGDDIPLISVDTATFKAVEIAIEKGYFKMESDRLYLLDKGKELLNVLKENEIMEDQIEFLERLGKKLTVSKVKGLTELTVSEQVNSLTKEIYLLNKQIDQNTPKLDGVNAQLGYVSLLRGKCESLFNSIESAMLSGSEIKLKIQTLEYDYDQYLQLRRLEKVGANIDGGVEIKKCPICESELFDTLGSQNVDVGPMSLETNIQFLKNQIDFYTAMERSNLSRIENLRKKQSVAQHQLDQEENKLLQLKSDLNDVNGAIKNSLRKKIELESLMKEAKKLSTSQADFNRQAERIYRSWKLATNTLKELRKTKKIDKNRL